MNTAALKVMGPAEAVPAVQSETAAVVGMVERCARDPSVDVVKMREIIAMRREMLMQDAEQAFNEAMSHIQGEMRSVAADASNPQTRSRYASFHALDRATRPIYTKHGLGLSFDTEEGAPENYIRVVCYVTRAAYCRKYRIDMPADGKGAKGGDVMTRTHAAGSAVTYGKRYLLGMIFNIAIGEDDDGNAANEASPRINQDQVGELLALIEDVGANKVAFLKYLKIDALADLPAKKFKDACDALNAKRAK